MVLNKEDMEKAITTLPQHFNAELLRDLQKSFNESEENLLSLTSQRQGVYKINSEGKDELDKLNQVLTKVLESFKPESPQSPLIITTQPKSPQESWISVFQRALTPSVAPTSIDSGSSSSSSLSTSDSASQEDNMINRLILATDTELVPSSSQAAKTADSAPQNHETAPAVTTTTTNQTKLVRFVDQTKVFAQNAFGKLSGLNPFKPKKSAQMTTGNDYFKSDDDDDDFMLLDSRKNPAIGSSSESSSSSTSHALFSSDELSALSSYGGILMDIRVYDRYFSPDTILSLTRKLRSPDNDLQKICEMMEGLDDIQKTALLSLYDKDKLISKYGYLEMSQEDLKLLELIANDKLNPLALPKIKFNHFLICHNNLAYLKPEQLDPVLVKERESAQNLLSKAEYIDALNLIYDAFMYEIALSGKHYIYTRKKGYAFADILFDSVTDDTFENGIISVSERTASISPIADRFTEYYLKHPRLQRDFNEKQKAFFKDKVAEYTQRHKDVLTVTIEDNTTTILPPPPPLKPAANSSSSSSSSGSEKASIPSEPLEIERKGIYKKLDAYNVPLSALNISPIGRRNSIIIPVFEFFERYPNEEEKLSGPQKEGLELIRKDINFWIASSCYPKNSQD